MRPTYAEIDLGAIAHNVTEIARLTSPSKLCAVVKADGYGHGDVPVAGAAIGAGAHMVAVALVEEGIRLREAGIEAPILLLSEPPPGTAADLAEWELEPTVYSAGFIEELADSGAGLRVHLKVDTGMHRVGASPGDIPVLSTTIRAAPRLHLASLWTHFAVADEDPGFTESQIESFDAIARSVEAPMTHLANTAGALLFPDSRGDMCRVGLGVYGLHPCEETRDVVDLRPAMRLVTQVTHTQRLGPGERPSYGRVRPLRRESTVVTAPIGYADGFPRALTTSGQAIIGGVRYPLAGTVTMDQIVIDVGDADIALGDEVVLLGRQDGQEISADEWADALGTISYEVVCSVGPRVPRMYP